MTRSTRIGLAMAALAAAGILASCLMDQPLARPEEAYDARADLGGDSLTRFDTVEVWLKGAGDPGRGTLLFKGPLASPESLGVHLGAGRDQVYVIFGYKRDRAGACFEARKPREREMTLLKDSCEPGEPGPIVIPPAGDPPVGEPPKEQDPPDSDPQGPGPNGPEPVWPRFGADSLDLSDSLPARMVVRDLGTAETRIRVVAAWLRADWWEAGRSDSSGALRDSALTLAARTAELEAGVHAGALILESGGQARDTLRIRVAVSQRYARGTVVDWVTGEAQRGIRVDLEVGTFGFTGADGRYALPVPAGRPRVSARFSSEGRIGSLDTIPVATDTGAGWATRLPSPATFAAVDLSGARTLGPIAAAAGYGIAVSTPFDQAGRAILVRLDAPRPAFLKSIPLGNGEGDPDNAAYFEAGDLAADSGALYIAYPEGARIERIGDWRGTPESRTAPAPLQPGCLLLDGPLLLALGRLDDGTLALARYRAADLALLGVDTLRGFSWDGLQPRRRSPRLIEAMGNYYAVDGNAPNAPGRLLRLDKETGTVTASREIPEGSAVDLVRIGARVYAGSAAPAAHRIRGFDADLAPADTLGAGGPLERLAADPSGPFSAYGFALAGKSVLAFVPGYGEPIGRLAIPTPLDPRWIAVDGPTRTLLVSDGATLFTAAFRPE